MIHGFEDGIDPFSLNNRNIPKTLSEKIIDKPSEYHVWCDGQWMEKSEVPSGYKQPISSVPIYNPAWTSFLFPVGTVILPDEEENFDITMEQINENSFNGEKFSEIVLTLPIINNLDSIPALISYDGAITIPMNKAHPSAEIAVDAINRILGAILLGGIRVEAIDSKKIETGCLLEGGKKAFSYIPSGHSRIRNNWASISELGVLLSLQVIHGAKLKDAYLLGDGLLETIYTLSPIFLLRGQSALYYHNLSDALSNLWIAAEQLTSFLWEVNFLKNSSFHPKTMKIKDRVKSFKGDSRTWSISVKHELLWQTKLLSDKHFSALSIARKSRNSLAHNGCIPDYLVIENLWVALIELLESASESNLTELRQLTTHVDPITKERVFVQQIPVGFDRIYPLRKIDFTEWPK